MDKQTKFQLFDEVLSILKSIEVRGVYADLLGDAIKKVYALQIFTKQEKEIANSNNPDLRENKS